MNRIRLLPEQVANQIAAGEVIERPASVVKELVENSIDADATRITVAIKNGGRTLVRVTDDGIGMNRDDALLSLERHATSKISTADDIQCIRTLGFRGEALPSVASVSRFTLTTRERGAQSGTQIQLAGGKILSVSDAGCAQGTTVEVRNLFFNLPARRKFLRSVATETAHIENVCTQFALAHPKLALNLIVEEREALKLAPAADLFSRIREIFGAEFCKTLVEIGAKSGKNLKIFGYIGRAGVSRANRSEQRVFVNGRPVDNRMINFALMEGYHTALMKGRFPVTILFIEIDPALVDVNIHPAKREVKFRDDALVRDAIIAAVRATIAPETRISTAKSAFSVAQIPISVPAEQQISTETVAPLIEPQREPFRIVGVVGQLYVIAESEEGMVLIDQHAAHERVLFEKMLRELDHAQSQKLLLPETVELDARDAAFLRENLQTLHRMGIGVSEFGDKTFLVDSLPPYFPHGNFRQIFADIVQELRKTGEEVHARRLSEDKIATTVCRHAVKARDPLKLEELRALLKQLVACDLPYTCPHGRPTMIRMTYDELEKKFGRKV
jgi:DNA mismatch repair protein MutL